MSTITKEFTKEQLIAKAREQIAFCRNTKITGEGRVHVNQCSALFEIALASLEAEAVCVIDHSNLDYLKSGSDADVWPASRTEMGDVLLYRAATPAPVSVPDDVMEAMQRVARIRLDLNDFDGDKRGILDCLGDAEDALIEVVNRRAAMLQGADGTLTNEGTKRVGELVMWVKRLASSLRKANPDSKLQSDAMDYLSRKGLIGVEDILR